MLFRSHVLIDNFVLALLANRSYGGSAERMTAEDLEQGKQWLSDTFYLIR